MPTEEAAKRTPWNQLPNETPLWFGRFEHYRLMWPHSVVEVYRDEWRGTSENQAGPTSCATSMRQC
jgi:hypothetical protein